MSVPFAKLIFLYTIKRYKYHYTSYYTYWQVPVVLFDIEMFMFLFEWGSWDSLHKVTLGTHKGCL